jgi:hypothetical protein
VKAKIRFAGILLVCILFGCDTREAFIEEVEGFKTPVRISIVRHDYGIVGSSTVTGEARDVVEIVKIYRKMVIGKEFFGTRVTFSDSSATFYAGDTTIYVLGK